MCARVCMRAEVTLYHTQKKIICCRSNYSPLLLLMLPFLLFFIYYYYHHTISTTATVIHGCFPPFTTNPEGLNCWQPHIPRLCCCLECKLKHRNSYGHLNPSFSIPATAHLQNIACPTASTQCQTLCLMPPRDAV